MDNLLTNSQHDSSINTSDLASPEMGNGKESIHVTIKKPTNLHEVFIADEKSRRQIEEIVSGIIPLKSEGSVRKLAHLLQTQINRTCGGTA